MKKYELTDQIKTIGNGHMLRRIRALINIPRYSIKAGDLGGWVESEKNLSQDGYCWISGDARVAGNALVCEYAYVTGNVLVDGDAWVSDNARIKGNVRVGGNTRVSGYARVMGRAHVQNGVIKSTQDYLVVGPIGSRDDYTTFYRAKGGMRVCCGCFNGSIGEFLQAVKTKHKGTRYELDYIAAAEFAKLKVWERQLKRYSY